MDNYVPRIMVILTSYRTNVDQGRIIGSASNSAIGFVQ